MYTEAEPRTSLDCISPALTSGAQRHLGSPDWQQFKARVGWFCVLQKPAYFLLPTAHSCCRKPQFSPESLEEELQHLPENFSDVI